MRRVAAAIGLVVVLAAVGYTLLPFARQAPRSTPAASTGYGAAGWQQPAQPPCPNSWQSGVRWCATAGGNRRTAALAVGGTATVSAAIMVLILPRRRKESRHPIFSAPTGSANLDQRIAA